jgi:hypothetical protein
MIRLSSVCSSRGFLKDCALRVGILAIVFLASILMSAKIAADDSHYAVLLIGNSHSSRGDLPDVLQQLLVSDGTTSARVEAARHWAFLSQRLEDGKTQAILKAGPWTHVVLQAQKYSTSGQYVYPTVAAEEWIRRSRSVGAQPILFPEWARRGNTEEGVRVHRLHMEIAAREFACVAPIGLAWEILLNTSPGIKLHSRDGNHANRNGALLTAYVLYATITGRPIKDLPQSRIRGVPVDKQIMLRVAAEEAISLFPPCSPTVQQ